MGPANNLPTELTSFVGREAQLADLRRLLRRARLLTLTGVGGAGKTRLALRLASSVAGRYPDGVWLVELASLADARLLEQTVAQALGVRESRRQTTAEVLVDQLRSSRSLLILDSCEHLLDRCSDLALRLLRSCSGVAIVATSREPLGIPGEVIWRTPSLSLPPASADHRPEPHGRSESERLFLERAHLVRPDLTLSEDDLAAVSDICLRLEGMPLAIELAASLIGLMSPSEILGRLRHRFVLLTGGYRHALARHQTLRHAVDWSYGLLSPEERALLARLSVFSGGFNLEAAEAVATPGVGGSSLVATLSALVNKSLVVAEVTGSSGARYRMLETIREYASEKLNPEEESEARRSQCAYFAEWSGRAASGLTSPQQMYWLKRVDEEQPNLRLAMSWGLAQDADSALRLSASMGAYWHYTGHTREGIAWLDQILALPGPPNETRATALVARCRLKSKHGDYAQAVRDAEQCIGLARRLGMKLELTIALNALGVLSFGEGDWEKAAQYFEEALSISKTLGEPERIGSSLNNLGLVMLARGDRHAALDLLNEAVELRRDSGVLTYMPRALDSLGHAHLLLGAFDEAIGSYKEALRHIRTLPDPGTLAYTLEGLGLVAISTGDPTRGMVLMGAASRQRSDEDEQPAPDWAVECKSRLTSAREQIDATAADEAWSRGHEMTLQEAITYALEEEPAESRPASGPLTARETEVAQLIAEGLTNAAVAAKLHVSERTVDAHVDHIRNKLAVRSRAQIAVWVKDRQAREAAGAAKRKAPPRVGWMAPNERGES